MDICLGALIGLMLLEKLNETIEKNVNSFLKLYIRIYFYFQIACGFSRTYKQMTAYQTYASEDSKHPNDRVNYDLNRAYILEALIRDN